MLQEEQHEQQHEHEQPQSIRTDDREGDVVVLQLERRDDEVAERLHHLRHLLLPAPLHLHRQRRRRLQHRAGLRQVAGQRDARRRCARPEQPHLAPQHRVVVEVERLGPERGLVQLPPSREALRRVPRHRLARDVVRASEEEHRALVHGLAALWELGEQLIPALVAFAL